MRVLHLLASDQRRGAETFAVTLDRELRARGVRSELLALAASGTDGLPVPALEGPRLGVRNLVRLRRHAGPADVVVAHGSAALPACALFLAGSGTPFVYVNIGDPSYWANTVLRRLRVRAFLSRAAAIAAISETSAEVYRRDFAVPRERIHVVPNGRCGAHFRPATVDDKRRARDRLGLPTDVPVALVLGALSPEKRVDLALVAAAQVPGLHVLVVGEGPLSSSLSQLATERLPGRAHLVGAVADPREVLHAADLLVLPSDSEGLPGVAIEAGLCGIPVVATDVGYVRDVVQDGLTGWLVPRGDLGALARALAEAAVAPAATGRLARQRCLRQFDLAQISERWLALLGSVAGTGRVL